MAVSATQSQPAHATNVVFICVDQWRGDALSSAGHPVVKTPYLDKIASLGASFPHAYSATPSCVPARVGLMTGQSQEAHGRLGYRDGVPFSVAHPETTLPQALRAAGYQTQAVGKMHVYPERSRLGFDDVKLHDGFLHHARGPNAGRLQRIDDYVPWLRQQPGMSATADYTEHGLNCNSFAARPWDKPESVHPTNWVVTEAIQWLERRDPTAPFFLFLSFHRPHPPFDPPQWAFDQYINQDLGVPPQGDWVDDYAPYRQDGIIDALVPNHDAETLHRGRAGYYGHITHIDHQIERFRSALQDYGLAADTALIFTSDHGDLMGDHGMTQKASPLEGSARIPLILRVPGLDIQDAAPEAVVELRDIMPTILDIVGVPIPESVDGKSLLPLVTGRASGNSEPGKNWGRDVIHGEHLIHGQSIQWVTDGNRKFIWMSGTGIEHFFNLEEDPGEVHNLAAQAECAEEVDQWRRYLIDFLADREEGFVQDKQLVAGRPVHDLRDFVKDRLAAARS